MTRNGITSTAKASLLALAIGVHGISSAGAGTPDGYTASMKVTDKGEVVTSATAYADAGKPVTMGLSSETRYGGEEGPLVKAGFSFELLPVPTAAGMDVELRLDRSEVVDVRTGALREEAAVLQGQARRTPDGWAYETDRLPGGKVLKVTFKETQRPE